MKALIEAVLGLIGLIVVVFVVIWIKEFWEEHDCGGIIINIVGFLGGLYAIGYGIATDSAGWCAFGLIAAIICGFNLWPE